MLKVDEISSLISIEFENWSLQLFFRWLSKFRHSWVLFESSIWRTILTSISIKNTLISRFKPCWKRPFQPERENIILVFKRLRSSTIITSFLGSSGTTLPPNYSIKSSSHAFIEFVTVFYMNNLFWTIWSGETSFECPPFYYEVAWRSFAKNISLHLSWTGHLMLIFVMPFPGNNCVAFRYSYQFSIVSHFRFYGIFNSIVCILLCH